MFIGKVADVVFSEPSQSIKCVSVSFKPSEIIFGKEPKFVGFTSCQENNDDESLLQEEKTYFENLGLKIGTSMIVGLTENTAPVGGLGITSDLRPMIAGCYPYLVRTDNKSEEETADFISGLKAHIDETMPN